MSQNFSRAFGEAVRRHREKKGLSQEMLAAQAGVHRTYVSSIERGKVRLGLDIAKQVADGLRVSLHTLIAEVEGADA